MPARHFGKARDASKYGKRHKPGVMNQTEAAYAALLEARKLAGEIIDWQFEPVTWKLATLCTYTPDFMVTLADYTIEFVDAKGGGPMDDKSRVKVKCAAEKFWQYRFVIEKKLTKKQAAEHGSAWKREEF